jgi:phosphotransferase system HPr (HPr) family protein
MPTRSELAVDLPADVDLHARPAANFVRAAMAFDAKVTVALDGREADAKSLLSVLALGAKAGSTLVLSAEGADGEAAVAGLAGCVTGLREAA